MLSDRETMRRAMLPLDGSIAEHAPAIVAAYARLIPPGEWPHITLVDFTAGSCLLPLLFGARGVGRLVVNDTAARSCLAARALFGRRHIDLRRVRSLVTTPRPMRRHVPSFHFASDYLTEDVAESFDRLFYARVPAAERSVYQYLALRWVLGFVPSPEHEFAILPTHEYDQLKRDRAHDWGPYIRRARSKLAVLASLAADINAAVARLAASRVQIRRADMLTLCREVDYGRRAFVIVNPPTRGLDEYVIDDQLAHSLLANRWLPLTRSRESSAQFWRSRVEAALTHLPVGSHALVWGGDGTLAWQQCMRVWRRHAEPVVERRVNRHPGAPGWAIVEKRR
jgi:hypothetical protein